MAKLSYIEESDELALTFAYDPDLVALAKTVDSYRWDKRRKRWMYPATLTSARSVIKVFDPGVGPGFEEWVAKAKEQQEAALRARALLDGNVQITGDFGFKFHTDPYQHQEAYANWAALRLRAGLPFRAFFSEQGTGKTKSEIDMTLWEIQESYLVGMPLVICPEHVARNWVQEIYTHAPPNTFAPTIIQGTMAQKIELLRQMPGVAQRTRLVPVPIVGYAVLAQPSQKKVYEAVLKLVTDGVIGKVIFDESTKVKNPTSNTGKRAYQLGRKAGIRVVMSGTPYAKRVTDIFQQMKILSSQILGSNYPAFARHICEYGGWQNREIIGYKPEAKREVEEAVGQHSFRRLLAECTDLPEEVHCERYCDYSKEQIRVTAQLRESMMAVMDGDEGAPWMLNAAEAITQILRFNQIASGFVRTQDPDSGDTKTAVFKKNPKLQLLMDIVENEIPEHDQFVVWCCYQFDVEQVVDKLNANGFPAAPYYGGPMSSKTKNALNETDFKAGKIRCLVATPDAGGYGLNWQNANWCLFYSYNFQWEHYAQAQARIRRLTQEKVMHYLWLVAQNPVTRDNSYGAASGVNAYIKANLDETGEMAKEMTGDYKKDPACYLRQTLEIM